QRSAGGNRSHVRTLREASGKMTNSRNHFRLLVGAALSVTVATVFAQNPPAAPPAAGAPQQQGRGGGGPPGPIAIPLPCTPEQIAAAQAPPDPNAGRGGRGGGRGGGTPCHMPDPREGLKAGKYDAGEAALNMKLVTTMKQPEGMFDPNGGGGL